MLKKVFSRNKLFIAGFLLGILIFNPLVTNFLENKQSFQENLILDKETSTESLIVSRIPKDAYDIHHASRRGISLTKSVTMVSFYAREESVENFIDSFNMKKEFGRFDNVFGYWGCKSFLFCPIPWWKDEKPKSPQDRNYFTQNGYLVTSDRVSETDRKVNLMYFDPINPK